MRLVTWSRTALNELKQQISFIAQDNPAAARRVANHIQETARTLGEMATGRAGRVSGTYEKPVNRLPYIIAYEIRLIAGRESIVILHVIHTSRDWQNDEWPH